MVGCYVLLEVMCVTILIPNTVVSTVKHLKTTVDDLKNRSEENKNSEVQEIIESPRVIDEIVVANSDAINCMKREISRMKSQERATEKGSKIIEDARILNHIEEIANRQKSIDKTILENSDAVKILDEEIKNIVRDKKEKESRNNEVDEALRRLDGEIQEIRKVEKESAEEILNTNDENKKGKKCKYFNGGYCKEKMKYRFTHFDEVCKRYLEDKCSDIGCLNRHPKPCKYFKSESGCRRGEACAYSHDLYICVGQRRNSFKCVSCKHEWKDSWCVVEHKVKNMEVYFCLNCNDWVKEKDKVLDQGWSLFEQDGNLNHFV
jgi:hypothetical protein